MKNTIDYKGYDSLIQPTDWRYSAAVVGLVQYLDYFHFDYDLLYNCGGSIENAVPGFDGVIYRQEDVDEEHYLRFAENYFAEDMTHLNILRILESEEFDDDKIKLVNDLVKRKTVLKNLAGKAKFDGTNAEYFKKLILENRSKIIKEIFRNGKNLYADYCNTNLLLTSENPHCRLVGYNVDEGRKTKFLGFCFSKDSFSANDIPEFDFIPFAFSKTYESYFINNNYSVQTLLKTKQKLEEGLEKTDAPNPRSKLFALLKESDEFVNYDVEIITKSRDEELFKTLFVRYEYLKRMKNINSEHISFKYKISDDYWLDLEREVYERCLNGVTLEDLIERMLKIYLDKTVSKITVKNRTELLIKINESWKEVPDMDGIESAKNMGFIVSKKLIEEKKANKINSYKQKLIGAIVAHDYDRVNEIILSLSSYVGMEFKFAYALFENPEENKGLAFSFANALNDYTNTSKPKGEN